jgi:hypothetical protein
MPEESFVEVRIEWEPDQGKGQFANHMLVNFDGTVFTLRFFQVLPPALGVLDEETIRTIESVPARNVATLVVAKETLASFADVLNSMVERHTLKEHTEAAHG